MTHRANSKWMRACSGRLSRLDSWWYKASQFTCQKRDIELADCGVKLPRGPVKTHSRRYHGHCWQCCCCLLLWTLHFKYSHHVLYQSQVSLRSTHKFDFFFFLSAARLCSFARDMCESDHGFNNSSDSAKVFFSLHLILFLNRDGRRH